ncbi:MAG: amino acid adenylation domain-containing protein [Pirellulaceae bacterium]|nr:amino acid adenylation domain-containing protein [Pirellulaceae bacterium]
MLQDDDPGVPLSFAQQRLWFLEQLEPDRAVYQIRRAVRLRGPLKVRALEQAIQEIVRRHSVLRTVIRTVDGQPVSRILENVSISLPVFDLSGEPSLDAELGGLSRRLNADANRPFDLGHDVLVRAVLYRIAAEEHVLLVVLHHIAADGWSLNVFWNELHRLYDAYCADRHSPLAELPLQYVDFARRQRALLQGERLDSQLVYWRANLADAPPVLELPADGSARAPGDLAGGIETASVSEELSQRLARLCGQQGTTLFSALLAAFSILLSRLAGQQDIVVGAPVAGRNQLELEGLIGLFLNTLALRIDLSGNPTFHELLGRVNAVCWGAYGNQDLPFEKLVEELQPERFLGRSPWFDCLINYLDLPPAEPRFADLQAIEEPLEDAPSKFALTLYIRRTENGLALKAAYRTAIFSAQRIRGMLQQLVHLLEQIADDPNASLESYSLLPREMHNILPDPHQALPDPPQPCVLNLFRDWARQAPDQVAIARRDRTWTYAQLDTVAGQIAGRLAAAGLQPHDVVALYGLRSFAGIAGLLGILLRGGVVLPLDPRLPPLRQREMLRQAKVSKILRVGTASESSGITMDFDEAEVIELDADTGRIMGGEVLDDVGGDAPELPIASIRPDDPAYIFFTSGTTGKPKGVLGSHKGLSHFINWQREQFDIRPSDRVSQLTGPSFDVVLRDLFLPLASGARVCLPEEHDVATGRALFCWLAAQQISVLHTVPSLADHWLRDAAPEALLPDLRWVFMAGEPLDENLVRRWRNQTGNHARMVNLYGPTETTMVKCFWELPPIPESGIQPIGQPLPQSQALILNREERLCGVGEVGQIVIRTPYRTLGYLPEAEPQNGKFVPNPFRNDLNDIVYCTGDMGRYRPDGTLEILGRCDDQLKIRGVRVEPKEVAAILNQHPAVQVSAVVALRNDRQEVFLAAYVVLGGDGASEQDLRRHLRAHLPNDFIPAAFVFLDKLPLTPNGKLDRRALPSPSETSRITDTDFVAPRTPLEEMLAGIWRDVLQRDQVGIHDDFFVLGGHSLLATRMVARVADHLQVRLPLRLMFEAPTIAQLADQMVLLSQDDPLPSETVGDDNAWDGPLPLSFAQQRLWFVDRLTSNLAAYNIPLAIRLSGVLNIAALEQSLQEIVRRHEVLRTVFETVDGQPVQRPRNEVQVPLPLVDLRHRVKAGDDEAELRRRMTDESARPFDLQQDLLLRAHLYRLDDQQHVLLLVIHHIASDGWSMSVLARELGALYEAYSAGSESPLPELPIQYADYAIWQRQQAADESFQAHLTYWQKQLDGAPTVLELPTDYPRPAVQTFRGARCAFVVPRAVAQQLKSLSQQEGVTLFTALLASFQVLLHRCTGRDDFLVGSPVAGRNQIELEQLIGFFVNTLVLRADLRGEVAFRQLLQRVHNTTLDAFEHQDVPLERLIEVVQPERDRSRNPLFQVLFALQNVPPSDWNFAGLDVARIEVDNQTAKCDLTVTVVDAPLGLRVLMVYNTDLFAASTVQRWADQWDTLLRAAVEDPDQEIRRLPLLSESELEQLTVDWNNTSRPYPRDSGLAELFEAQAANNPEATAVSCGAQRLSYRELNERSNQLASYLESLGVERGTLVAVCLERSIEWIVGLLAIVKAGGTYVPLAAEYPRERLRTMLLDCGAPVVVTDSSCVDAVREFAGRLVLVDQDRAETNRQPTENVPPRSSGGDLAYLMYTSGSTGRPKGTGIPQRAIARLVLNADYVQLTSDDVVAQAANASFDAATFEIWGALLNGARLELLDRQTVTMPDPLRAKIDSAGITTMFVTTALLNQLVGESPEVFSGLKHLLFGGEAVTPHYVRQLLRGGGPRRLLHVYGPTETTTFATWQLVEHVPDDATTIPIGRPIANTTVYLLDDRMQPVPVGTAGEIYIGGDGVAVGYWNRPELTAERFVSDPFARDQGQRLYRTGDLARWRPDGAVEFLGRVDGQVKLRGFRIEPGEIEAVLARHAAVGACAVAVRVNRRGDKCLVAYFVATATAAPATEELREFLAQSLPDYMIPAAFVRVPSLPLTPNGKVDHASLPDWQAFEDNQRSRYLAPSTSTQIRLAKIWAEVMRMDRVGLHDNFFELGGHSLLGVKMFSRIEREFHTSLPMATLFQAPTVESLAHQIDTASMVRQRSLLVPIQPHGQKPPFFCVHGGAGHVMLYRDVALALGADQPFFGIEPAGREGLVRPCRCVEEMAATYLSQIRTIQPVGPYYLGGYSFGGLVALEIAQQLHQLGQTVNLLAMFDTGLPGGRDAQRGIRHSASQLTRRTAWAVNRLFYGSLYRLYGRLGRPVPMFVRKLALRDASYRATAAYSPKPYPGPITYFRAVGEDSNGRLEGWPELSLGGLDIQEVHGRHQEMFRGIAALELARLLRAALERAQTETNGSIRLLREAA